MTTIKLDPEGYRLTLVCGVAGVWDNTLCFENPTEEILNIASLFSTAPTTTREEPNA